MCNYPLHDKWTHISTLRFPFLCQQVHRIVTQRPERGRRPGLNVHPAPYTREYSQLTLNIHYPRGTPHLIDFQNHNMFVLTFVLSRNVFDRTTIDLKGLTHRGRTERVSAIEQAKSWAKLIVFPPLLQFHSFPTPLNTLWTSFLLTLFCWVFQA